ncbi:MAG: ABC transporter permease subunit [Verrucomicrobiales bacterium]|jgi:microcin C transport system permease protein|nr:ABC transporter permease subunit [Verrucomicrobiales bacterium]MEC7357590.1 ABC transporter permease subunit [Verrucomicrobiota bacterium]
MREYFIRRFLLIPPTLLGVTMIVFAITRLVPGGPIEHFLEEAQKASEGASSSGGQMAGGMNEEQIEKLEEEYGYDKPIFTSYLQWLGVLPRERFISKADFRAVGGDKIGTGDLIKDTDNEVLLVLKNDGRQVKVTRRKKIVISAVLVSSDMTLSESADLSGWQFRIETKKDRQERWAERNKEPVDKAPQNYDDRVVGYKKAYAGILQGRLGVSTEFGDPVWSLIKDRIPIALYFGILTALITYGISLPLGILKAIKHRSAVDNLTSVLIFIGYAIPGFALGAVMLIYLGARGGWFPLFGLTSADFSQMNFFEQIMDLAHHTVLPLTCYVIGGFAWLTMMMKNNLMENLATDYVRTAVAKGVSFRSAVFKHAFRNSIIPIASTMGQLITMIVGGSILIESVFDIQGFGLLQYQALLGRDQTVIMGTLTIAAALLLIGNVLSDIIVAIIDPRVKFN